MERRGDLDDYGHHPVEIAAVLSAARAATEGKVIAATAVWQTILSTLARPVPDIGDGEPDRRGAGSGGMMRCWMPGSGCCEPARCPTPAAPPPPCSSP